MIQEVCTLCGKPVETWKKAIEDALFGKRLYRDLAYSAAHLATALNVGDSTLSKILQGCYGCNYNELVNSRRIVDACKLLDNPKKELRSVDEIGLSVGFRNRQSFFTAFKKYTGTTPMKYKRNKNQ